MDTTTQHTTRAVRRKAQRRIARIVATGRFTLLDLGIALGVQPSTVYRWAEGSLPRGAMARKILERRP